MVEVEVEIEDEDWRRGGGEEMKLYVWHPESSVWY